MKLSDLKAFGVVILCGVITPFIYSLCFTHFTQVLEVSHDNLVLVILISSAIHLVVVSLLTLLSFGLVRMQIIHRAAIFSASALLTTRLAQVVFEDGNGFAMIQGATLFGACFLVYGFFFWRSQS